jgi:CheY-like chemotaxis protein
MDDDLQVNKVVSRILERLGYRIEVSYDGREALTQYQSALTSGNPFNAVIMDLTIPGGMGGKETIQELLKMDPQARAIVASGYSNDPVLSEYKKYGFKGMITKPFTIDSLRNILHQVLQS